MDDIHGVHGALWASRLSADDEGLDAGALVLFLDLGAVRPPAGVLAGLVERHVFVVDDEEGNG